MKKLFAILALVSLCGIAQAGMNDISVSYTLITTNSDSDTYTLRGELEGVYVNVAATKTNAVLITDEFGSTLFNAAISTDGFYPIRVPLYGTTGALITFIGGGATNDTANTWYGKYPMAGEVTIRIAGHGASTGTNAVSATLIYNQ